MPLEMCYLLLTLKNYWKRAQICDRFLNILPCSADFTHVDRPTILEVYREFHLSINLRVFDLNVFQK